MTIALILFLTTSALAFGSTLDATNDNNESSVRSLRYLFYDVNPPEGFNLRRDVYMRIAILISELQKSGPWVLVLLPWPRLYHWKSPVAQERSAWSSFFDLASMQKFAPVIELMDFLDMHPGGKIDQIYVLQHFEEMFKTGVFVDKLELQKCREPLPFSKNINNRYFGNYWRFGDITAGAISCLSYHGHASMIAPFLQKSSHSAVLLDHAEVLLHDRFGDSVYWRARRSMRFAKPLREIADNFRRNFLNSTDEQDMTILQEDWTLEKQSRSAIGGPYICVHLRRRDFVTARSKEVPSLSFAANQIKQVLKNLNLTLVFASTDAPQQEKNELEDILKTDKIELKYFEPTSDELYTHKDGGVAIIEQIICSHARKFLGTHESTFSFRIQEEREILGFLPKMTFNRLCGDTEKKCQQPTKWLIQF